MRYSYSVAAGSTRSILPLPEINLALSLSPGVRAEADHRWPAIVRKLTALRRHGRRCIRIVDANCGAGDLLIQVVRRARALGFLAIEGRGIDRDAAKIARALTNARAATDPAIGLHFEIGDARDALREEIDFPADIVLHAAAHDDIARSAGETVLGSDDGAAA